jgi:hypothetical protein
MTNWLRFFFAHNASTKTDYDARFSIIKGYVLKLCSTDVSKARKVT